MNNPTTIGEMRVGQDAWTLPWAVHAPPGWRWLLHDYYLHAGYPAFEHPSGTISLRVFRDNRGWHIDDSAFHKGFCAGLTDQYHDYWRYGRSVPVRSVRL